ncbi:MAG: biotin--[Oscillospiraceae bacterium]|nr:biotin--[acetyl-CoA-carboxylase] ligase [Oscillospiraceae bacterium]
MRRDGKGSLKNRVLAELEANRGKSVSGNKIANNLGITRSAVWKGVMQLREDGYVITAVTNRGYCLTQDNNLLNEPAIRALLRTHDLGRHMDVFRTVDSTNIFAKKLAEIGAPTGHTVIAESQTEGKGRMGRSFHSPGGQGIYMSVIVRPELSIAQASNLTACCAVAVCEAIEEAADISCGIKWVNDVYIHNKKVCGILTEAAMNVEEGTLDYAVIGIGLNVNNTSFPDDISEKATSIRLEKGEYINRSVLCADILNHLETRIDSMTDGRFMTDYRARSILDGRNVLITNGDDAYPAKVLGIDEEGRLMIRHQDGREERIVNGSIEL